MLYFSCFKKRKNMFLEIYILLNIDCVWYKRKCKNISRLEYIYLGDRLRVYFYVNLEIGVNIYVSVWVL